MYGNEALDQWIAVIRRISEEAYSNPELVKTSPHNQAVHRLKPDVIEDPDSRAMTWRAFQRKRLRQAPGGADQMRKVFA
jgi:glycine dehydrogenase subunit 2